MDGLASTRPDKRDYATIDQGEVHTAQPHPDDVSWFSFLTFTFANPVMSLGNKRQLDDDDLFPLPAKYETAAAFADFEPNFKKTNGSIVRASLRTYGWTLMWCGLAEGLKAACSILSPAVLHHVVDALSHEEVDMVDLSIWLGLFFAVRIINAITFSQMLYYVELVALHLMVSIRTLLMRKSMRRSVQSKNDKESIDTANLFTSDVDNVLMAAFTINNAWIMPIQITAVIIMLYYVIDLAAFAGLGIILVSMLASYLIAMASGSTMEEVMKRKDDRMRVVKEIFGAIQIVKLNAWEGKFKEKLMQARAVELQQVAKFMYLGALNIFVLWGSPLFVSIASFSVYSLVLNYTLTPAKVFTAIALFSAIQESLRGLPSTIQQIIQAKVSIDRFTRYFNLDEIDMSNVTKEDSSQPEDVAISVEDATFAWETDKPLLSNVNMQVKKGDLVVIHGSVGAGKSSLCSALLGEMHKLSGKVFVRGNVAYYSQEAWIQNMSVKDNILFGLPFDEEKYNKVLGACGLIADLNQLPAGDATEIGQKGVNLSGGQKARVSLARACYADADVIILDTPLAAVDAVVQQHIFRKCICNLLESKTVVLVTHSQDVIESSASNYKILVDGKGVHGERHDRTSSRRELAGISKEDAVTSNVPSSISGKLVLDEEREEGRVSASVFKKYFDAIGGIRVCIFLLVVQALWQAFKISSDIWISWWTDGKLPLDTRDSVVYNMRVYALLGLGSAVMVGLRTMTIAVAGLRASKYVFEAMTSALLSSPLRFFDANPIGRIVNRYADDISKVDFDIPFAFGTLLAMCFIVICQLSTAIYMVDFLGFFIIPLVYFYIKMANFYLAPAREVARLWRTSLSPALNYTTQAEEGVTVIRAFGQDTIERTVLEANSRLDKTTRVWFGETVLRSWFALRMQLIGCAVIIGIVSSLLYLHSMLSPGIVGLAFTYALTVDGELASIVDVWVWMETSMVSPERILEYASLPSEGSSKPLVLEPSPEWPTQGTVDFEDVMFSYKEDGPRVLKGLSFSIQHNEKIGIVGRTGAGKSSLTMALFRINELISGRIVIDGKDISTLPLQTLRSNISIIPQNPVLFKGTLKAYIDPFDEYSEEEIWSAMDKVEMGGKIRQLEGQLEFELSENGENFSVGERQMLCMARALLTKSKIIVMDEATAAIDRETERKLQEMVERDFEDATVLTIAHRLSTVIDCDRILVMSDGRMLEFDSPKNLAKDESGAFYQLAKEGGVLDKLL